MVMIRNEKKRPKQIDINNLSKEMNSYRPDSSLQDVNLTNFDNWKSYVSKSIETI